MPIAYVIPYIKMDIEKIKKVSLTDESDQNGSANKD